MKLPRWTAGALLGLLTLAGTKLASAEYWYDPYYYGYYDYYDAGYSSPYDNDWFYDHYTWDTYDPYYDTYDYGYDYGTDLFDWEESDLF